MSWSGRARCRALLLAGVGFVLLEVAASWIWPSPLDPKLTVGETLAAAGGLAALLWLAGALSTRALGRHGVPVAACLWAAVWAPEGLRAGGHALWLAVVVVGVVAAVGVRWPGLCLVLTVLGGAWTPALRIVDEGAGWAAGEPGAQTRVLLITVDTARADVQAFGEDRFPSAEGWIRYPAGVAAAPWTLPSMTSLFTGMSVAEHGGGLATPGGWSARRAGTWWPATLATQGWSTAAFVSNPHLSSEMGFNEGFGAFFHADRAREPLVLVHNLRTLWGRVSRAPSRRESGRDDRVIQASLSWIRARTRTDGPALVWVHLLGPHEYHRWLDPLAPATSSGAALGTRQVYDGNLDGAARRVRRLTEAAPDWWTVITADHGEAFGEGGVQGHGHGLQDAELLVPMLVRAPGGAGVVIGEAAALQRVGDLVLAVAQGGRPAPEILVPPGGVGVAGVRADPARAAVRSPDGRYRSAPPPEPGRPRVTSAETRAALRAIGYID